jgi:RsiW-degrading membrane proteinase PrsW (M82 family)
MNINFGRYKAWFNRIASYISVVNFMLLVYGFIFRDEPFNIPWYLWLIVIALFITGLLWFDLKFVLRQAQDYLAKKNPFLVRMQDDIKKIMKHLEIDE